MVKITTERKTDFSDCLLMIDPYFNLYVAPKWDNLSDIKYKVLEEVDLSTYIGDRLVSSSFGKCRLTDISSGAKTCLSILYQREIKRDYREISLNECGPHAVKVCLDLLDGSGLSGWYRQVTTPQFSGILEVDGVIVHNRVEYAQAATICKEDL
jgi:hypothetical protein